MEPAKPQAGLSKEIEGPAEPNPFRVNESSGKSSIKKFLVFQTQVACVIKILFQESTAGSLTTLETRKLNQKCLSLLLSTTSNFQNPASKVVSLKIPRQEARSRMCCLMRTMPQGSILKF